MAYKAGKTGSINYGGTVLSIKKWKAKHKVDGKDTTSTTSGGHREFGETLDHVEWSADAEWDATLHPYAATPNVKPGIGPEVKLFVDAADSDPTYDMPVTFIDDVDVEVDVEGIVKWTITAKSNGTYTFNG